MLQKFFMCMLVLLFVPAGALAQTRTDSLGEAVVTGLNGQQLKKESPAPVDVVTADELKHISFSNIIDAVAHKPGMAQITTGSGISKPVIRGLGYNRVVVVNDGIRQEGQQWGDEHGIEIDPQTIGKVEILKGPASLMYGSDAMAGALVFHPTSFPEEGKVEGNVSSEYHSNNGLLGYSLNVAGNKRGIVWSTRYSEKMAHDYKNRYDGYVYGTGFRERAFTQRLGYNGKRGSSHLTLSYYHLTPDIAEGERDEETGAFVKSAVVDGEETLVPATHHDFKSYSHGMPYQQVRHYKAVLDNTLSVGSGMLKLLLGYQQNRRQEFEEAASPDECGLDFRLHTANYGLRYLSPTMSGWKMAVGVGGMYQRSLNEGTEYLIPAYHLFDLGLYATVTKDVKCFHFSGGLRFDRRHLHGHSLFEDGEERFSDFSRSFNGVTGSVGAVFNAMENMNIRFNLSRGFRTPDVNELGANGVHEGTARYEMGNAALRAENSLQADFGIDYSSSWLAVQMAVFANRIDNYIFSARQSNADGSPMFVDGVAAYRFSSGDARLIGGEMSVDVHPVGFLHWENAFSYVNAVQLHRPAEEKYLPLTPAPRFTSDLRFDLPLSCSFLANTFVKFGVEYCLRQNHYYKANATETATPAYALLDLSAGTDFRLHRHCLATLTLGVDNLTDCAYQSHLSRLKYTDTNAATGRMGIYGMGRCVSVKLQLHINR